MALALPARATRRLIMQKARSHPQKGLLQLEGAWFQVLFHSPRGVLFTFPSRYSFAIGRWLVFSLGGWALRIRTGFHVSRPTWDTCTGGGGRERERLESRAAEGDSPVREAPSARAGIPSRAGHVKPRPNPEGPPSKAEH